MLTPFERYQNDPLFHSLVDNIYAELKQCKFTATELREAVILAAIMYEQERTHSRSVYLEKRVIEFLDNRG